MFISIHAANILGAILPDDYLISVKITQFRIKVYSMAMPYVLSHLSRTFSVMNYVMIFMTCYINYFVLFLGSPVSIRRIDHFRRLSSWFCTALGFSGQNKQVVSPPSFQRHRFTFI